jgi:hypothetical protein
MLQSPFIFIPRDGQKSAFLETKRRFVIKIRLYSGFLRKNRFFRLFEVLSLSTVGVLYCHLCSHILLNLEGKDGA